MVIDIIFLVFLTLGFYLGFSRGVIHSLFSFIGLFLGLLISIKWSHNVSLYLHEWLGLHGQWLPVLTFVLLFILVIILVHFLSNLLEGTFSKVGLGFLNKFAGAFLWCLILTFVLSILLWFANELHWLSADYKAASTTYKYLEPIGPTIIKGVGNIIPWFKDEFEKLQQFVVNTTPPAPRK